MGLKKKACLGIFLVLLMTACHSKKVLPIDAHFSERVFCVEDTIRDSVIIATHDIYVERGDTIYQTRFVDRHHIQERYRYKDTTIIQRDTIYIHEPIPQQHDGRFGAWYIFVILVAVMFFFVWKRNR